MYLQHFGLTHDPLGKRQKEYIDTQQYKGLEEHCQWLLQSRGVGLITGGSGTGKTAAIRRWTSTLNPHQYTVHYQADNHFKPFDIYCQLAERLGLETQHRYSLLWRSIKTQLLHLYQNKCMTTLWILDEAQNLPYDFITELPSFLNVNFDTQETIIILLIGTPKLHSLIKRATAASLASRLQFHYQWQPLQGFEAFANLVNAAFVQAGRSDTLISDTGMQTIHLATKGRLRYAHRIITRSMQIACQCKQNYLPDEIIADVIEELRTMTI